MLTSTSVPLPARRRFRVIARATSPPPLTRRRDSAHRQQPADDASSHQKPILFRAWTRIIISRANASAREATRRRLRSSGAQADYVSRDARRHARRRSRPARCAISSMPVPHFRLFISPRRHSQTQLRRARRGRLAVRRARFHAALTAAHTSGRSKMIPLLRAARLPALAARARRDRHYFRAHMLPGRCYAFLCIVIVGAHTIGPMPTACRRSHRRRELSTTPSRRSSAMPRSLPESRRHARPISWKQASREMVTIMPHITARSKARQVAGKTY